MTPMRMVELLDLQQPIIEVADRHAHGLLDKYQTHDMTVDAVLHDVDAEELSEIIYDWARRATLSRDRYFGKMKEVAITHRELIDELLVK